MATSTAQMVEGIDERLFGENASGWSNSYTQFLSRSVANTQKTLQLYQRTLEYVAGGRLPATVFQEYYPQFIQKHGPLYAQRLAHLGAEFMSGLAELNRRGAVRDDDNEITAPTFEASAPSRWFEEYAEYAGKLNARALKAYRRQLDQIAGGELTPDDMQEKMAGEMSRQLPVYMHDAGQIYLKLMHELDALRGNYEEEYLGGILALADEPAKDAVTDVVLRAPLGGVAFRSFTITNTTGVRTSIRYVATEVRRVDGVAAAFSPKVAITPEVLELGPGEEAVVTFSIQLEANRYEVETPYVGFLYVTGDGDLRVELQLRIIATGTISDKN